MPYLLNLAYLLLLLAASPYLAWKAVRVGKYRHGWREKFLGLVPRREGNRPCFWFHAVSVGEVNLLPGLIKELERRLPEAECVVSTTTRTGMELARKRFPALAIFYCPLDFTWAVAAAMRRVRPDVLVLAELELWPNLIRAARRAGAKVVVVNGRLSEASFRGYRRIRPLAASILRQIDLVAVQDETYAERFRQLGAPADRVQVTGSLKYDGAQTDRNNPTTRRLRQLAGLADGDAVFLAGSTQEPEEQVALDVWRELSAAWPRLRLVLVPRHAERFESVARMLATSGIPWQRRTALDVVDAAPETNPSREPATNPNRDREGAEPTDPNRDREGAELTSPNRDRRGAEPTDPSHDREGVEMTDSAVGPLPHGRGSETTTPTAHGPRPTAHGPRPTAHGPRVLLVDVIGELGAWWGTARVAFVGGSLGNRGGQNMIEPAAYGAAVSFGPNTRNFRDIVAAMLAHQAAVVVPDGPALARFVRRMLEHPEEAETLGRRARDLVLSQQGATARTGELLQRLLAGAAERPKNVRRPVA